MVPETRTQLALLTLSSLLLVVLFIFLVDIRRMSLCGLVAFLYHLCLTPLHPCSWLLLLWMLTLKCPRQGGHYFSWFFSSTNWEGIHPPTQLMGIWSGLGVVSNPIGCGQS